MTIDNKTKEIMNQMAEELTIKDNFNKDLLKVNKFQHGTILSLNDAIDQLIALLAKNNIPFNIKTDKSTYISK